MKSTTISSNAMSLHQPVPDIHLTPRQREVLSLLCEGLPNKLICRQLNIATGTVKVHIGVILRELGVTSRLQAVVAASRRGLFGEGVQSAPQHAPSAAVEPMMLRIFRSGTSTGSAHGAAS